MDKKRELELIKMEVLGSIDKKDIEKLNLMKKTHEKFPWELLAEYQNLIALLPSTLIFEKPSLRARDNMIRKLKHFIFEAEDKKPQLIEEKKTVGYSTKKITKENKIDWGALSISDSLLVEKSPKDKSSFQEVKPKKSLIWSDKNNVTELIRKLEKKEPPLIYPNRYKIITSIILSFSKISKKYAVISVISIIATITVFTYFLMQKTDEIKEVQNELLNSVYKAPVVLENTINDNSIEFVNVENNKNIPVEEIQPEVKKPDSNTEQNIISKEPIALPEPIDAPLVDLTIESPIENYKSEMESIQPPPKEIDEITEEPTYFIAVEEMPEPLGGLQEIQDRIIYPEIAIRAGVEGKVFVRAYIDESGRVTNAEIVKGIGAGCDEAALDAILTTKFKPGKQRGKPIKVQVTIPILFKQ